MNKHKTILFISTIVLLGTFVFAQDSLTPKLSNQKSYFPLNHPFLSEQTLLAGDIVTFSQPQDENLLLNISKSDVPYDPQILGVTATDFENEDVPFDIAILGETYVNVTDSNGIIKKGDFITSSSIPGVGIKATQKGFVLGKALEGFQPSLITPLPDQENVPEEQKEQLGKIKILISPSWLDDSYFLRQQAIDNPELNNFETSEIAKENLSNLKVADGALEVDTTGNLRLDGALISTGNITSTGDATLLNLYVVDELTTNKIQVPAFDNLNLQLGDSLGATKLSILDSDGTLQASIDSEGKLASNSATFDKLSINPKKETIGRIILPAGKTSVFVENSKVTENSYIFLTPLNSTGGQVAYIASQQTNKGFTVTIDLPLSRDVQYNFWIIN